MAFSAYNRKDATDYAIKWANGQYNPDWPSYAKNDCPDCGGDCTNFISQALFAGGWTMDGSWFSYFPYNPRHGMPGTGRGMFYGRSQTSPAWAVAQQFADYLRIYSRRAAMCERNQLELGDVVQIRTPTGLIHHTAMVTKVDWADPMPVPAVFERATGRTFDPVATRKVLFISSHTSDLLNQPFDEWEEARVKKVGDTVIYWHILDSFKSQYES
jgi:hypothetical protein